MLTYLRHRHPNFWLSVMVQSGWYMFLGLNTLLTSYRVPFGIPSPIAGVLFLGVGLCLLVVANMRDGGRKMKPILVFGAALCFVWAVGYVLLFADGTSPSLAGAILFAFQGLLQVPQILEPSVNPATRESNDRK